MAAQTLAEGTVVSVSVRSHASGRCGINNLGSLRSLHFCQPVFRAAPASGKGIVPARIQHHQIQHCSRTFHFGKHKPRVHSTELEFIALLYVCIHRNQIIPAPVLYAVT